MEIHMSATLSDLTTAAAAIGLTPVLASGPTSGPYVSYHLTRLRLGPSSSVAELVG